MRLAPMSRAVGTNGKRTESKSLIIFHYSQNLWLFWMDSSKMFINSLNIPKGSKWENVQQSFTQMVDRSRDSTHHKTKSMPPKKDAISKRKQSSKQWPQQKYRRNKGSLYHWCPSIWPYESLVIILFWGIGWWYLRGWLVMQLVHNYHHKGFNLDVTMMFMTETTIMKLFSWGLTGGRLQFSWLPLPPFRFEGRPPFPKQRRCRFCLGGLSGLWFNESWSRYFNLRGGWSTPPKNAGMSTKEGTIQLSFNTIIFQGELFAFGGVWHVNHPPLLFLKGRTTSGKTLLAPVNLFLICFRHCAEEGRFFTHSERALKIKQLVVSPRRFNHSFAVVVSQESVQTGCQKTCITISHRETQLQNNGSEVWFALFPSG